MSGAENPSDHPTHVDSPRIDPLLTVITVCLNRAGTIAAALDSVVRQQAADVEHLVIDGDSTDDTLSIISKYNFVRVVSEPDRGLYDAMNKGIRLARGAYVLLLNSDDTLSDGIIDAARPFMTAGYDVICFGTDFLRRGRSGTPQTIETMIAPDIIALSTKSVTLGSPLINAKIFRRDFLAEVGSFDLRYSIASDVDLLLRATLLHPRVAVLPIVGHHYWEHDGSLTINAVGNNGRLAAMECLSIADIALARDDLPIDVRGIIKAWRGGKLVMHALYDDRAVTTRLVSVFKVFVGVLDVFHYLRYLAYRKWRRLQT